MTDLEICKIALENCPDTPDEQLVERCLATLRPEIQKRGYKKVFKKIDRRLGKIPVVDYKTIYYMLFYKKALDFNVILTESMSYSTKKGTVHICKFPEGMLSGQDGKIDKVPIIIIHSHAFERLRERSGLQLSFNQAKDAVYRTLFKEDFGIAKCNKTNEARIVLKTGTMLGVSYNINDQMVFYFKTYVSNGMLKKDQLKLNNRLKDWLYT